MLGFKELLLKKNSNLYEALSDYVQFSKSLLLKLKQKNLKNKNSKNKERRKRSKNQKKKRKSKQSKKKRKRKKRKTIHPQTSFWMIEKDYMQIQKIKCQL